MSKCKGYADLGDFEEDKRIDIIGHTVMDGGKTVVFVTDSDDGKADRYVEKLKAKFPGIRVVDRFYGPVANTVTVKVAPPDHSNN